MEDIIDVCSNTYVRVETLMVPFKLVWLLCDANLSWVSYRGVRGYG